MLVKNQARATLQEIWRQAYRTKQQIVAEFPTTKAAQKMKFALYNATRMVRKGKEAADAELEHAIANVSIRVDGCKVIVERRDAEPGLAIMATAAGLDAQAEVPDAMERALAEAQERMVEELAPPAVNPLVKRYY